MWTAQRSRRRLSTDTGSNMERRAATVQPLWDSQAHVAGRGGVHVVFRPHQPDVLVQLPVILHEGADLRLVMRLLQGPETDTVTELLQILSTSACSTKAAFMRSLFYVRFLRARLVSSFHLVERFVLF